MSETTLEQELKQAAEAFQRVAMSTSDGASKWIAAHLAARLRTRLAHLQTLRAIAWTLGEKWDLVVMDGMNTASIPASDDPPRPTGTAAPKASADPKADSAATRQAGPGDAQYGVDAAKPSTGDSALPPAREQPGDACKMCDWAFPAGSKSCDNCPDPNGHPARLSRLRTAPAPRGGR